MGKIHRVRRSSRKKNQNIMMKRLLFFVLSTLKIAPKRMKWMLGQIIIMKILSLLIVPHPPLPFVLVTTATKVSSSPTHQSMCHTKPHVNPPLKKLFVVRMIMRMLKVLFTSLVKKGFMKIFLKILSMPPQVAVDSEGVTHANIDTFKKSDRRDGMVEDCSDSDVEVSVCDLTSTRILSPV